MLVRSVCQAHAQLQLLVPCAAEHEERCKDASSFHALHGMPCRAALRRVKARGTPERGTSGVQEAPGCRGRADAQASTFG